MLPYIADMDPMGIGLPAASTRTLHCFDLATKGLLRQIRHDFIIFHPPFWQGKGLLSRRATRVSTPEAKPY